MNSGFPVLLSEVVPTLELVNNTVRTQTIVYVRENGSVDTLEVGGKRRAVIPTQDLVTVPSIAVFSYDPEALRDPHIQRILGLPNSNPVPMTLRPLVLSDNVVVENIPNTTLIGTFSGSDPDATLSVVVGGAVLRVVGHSLYPVTSFDYETAVSHALTVRQTDPHYPANWRETSFVVLVQNVLEVNLKGLSPLVFILMDTVAAGTTLFTLINRTVGSTLQLVNAADRVTLDSTTGVISRGTAPVTENFSFGVRETAPDAAARVTTINVTVQAAVGTPLSVVFVPIPDSTAPVAANTVLSYVSYTVGAPPRPANLTGLDVTVEQGTPAAATGATLTTLGG